MLEWWRKFYIKKGWLIVYRLKAPFRAIKRFLLKHFTISRVAIIFILITVFIIYLTRFPLEELWVSLIPEFISIAITIIIIDAIYNKRSEDEQKNILIGKMGSNNNNVATEAWEELDARGWGSDGSLRGKFLISTNLDGNSFTGADMRNVMLSFSSLKNTTWIETDLEGASLDHTDFTNSTLSSYPDGPFIPEANLKDVSLFNANLMNARVRHEQLIQVRTLSGAIMPDGKKYDGRYRLPSEVERIKRFIRKRGGDIESPGLIAAYYGVPVEDYIAGQKWADRHPQLFKK